MSPAERYAPRNASLVAVRFSGQPFLSDYNVQSPEIIEACERMDAVRKQLDESSRVLVDSLYQEVQAATSEATRYALIDAKRDVFNFRRLKQEKLQCLENNIRDRGVYNALCRYDALIQEREYVKTEAGVALVRGLRERLHRLMTMPDVAYIINYSLHRLLAQLTPATSDNLISDADMTAYSYLTRMFAKANPCHLFSAIGPINAQLQGPVCQVIVDTSLLRNLEQSALQAGVISGRTYIYLACGYQAADECIHFVACSPMGLWQRVSLRCSPALSRVMEFFRSTSPDACTEENLFAYFKDDAAGLVGIDPVAVLERLYELGVVARYLIRDDDRFAEDMTGHDVAMDRIVEPLQRLHLSSMAPRALPDIHSTFQTRMPREGHEKPQYFVDYYLPVDSGLYGQVVSRIADDLLRLKPLLMQRPNFSAHSALLSSSIRRALGVRNRKAILLPEFLEDLIHSSEHKRLRGLRSASGPELRKGTSEEEEHLLAFEGINSETPLGRVCVNGVYDRESDLFFISNLFAPQRYLCRYRLAAFPEQPHTGDEPSELQVQVVVPWTENRAYVPAILPAGISFDGRYRHIFKEWVNPSEVNITINGDHIEFRHATTGKRLDFVHYGFVLSEFLPLPYQILLIGKSDAFHHPFPTYAVSTGLSDSKQSHFVFHRGLISGKIGLRRDRWTVQVAWLKQQLGRYTDWRLCLELRSILHTETASKTEHWYYAVPKPGKGLLKPAYLDLRNPLSTALFRRRMNSCPPTAQAIFTKMCPSPDQLLDGRVTELMIEI